MDLRTVSLVLVDDNTAFRESVRALLDTEPGLTVVAEAHDGPTAIRLIGELTPDVVIMDVIMPNVNGIETTRQVVAASPAIKVIALSMHGDNNFVSAMQDAGASGYVLKDQVLNELVAAIRAVTSGQTHFRRQAPADNPW